MNLKPLRPDQQQKSSTRWNYQRQSQDFVQWVNKLGIERTWAGRAAHFLDSKFRLRRFVYLFIFAILLSFLVSWDLEFSYLGYKESDLATGDIKSPLSFEVMDADQTSKRRFEAEDSIPPVFDYDVGLYEQVVGHFHQAMRQMRESKSFTVSDFQTALGGVRVSDELFKILQKNRFSVAIESAVTQALAGFGGLKIVEDLGFVKTKARGRVIINVLERGFKGEEFVIESSAVTDLHAIKRRIQNLKLDSTVQEIAASLLVPNLTLNKQDTELRRQKARDAVSPVLIQIKKGQTIVRQGEPIQHQHLVILDALRKFQATRHQDFVALIMAVLLVTLLFCFGDFLSRFMSLVYVTGKDAFAMGSITLFVVVCAKFALFVTHTAFVDRFVEIPTTFYAYLIPMSSAAMMVGLLIPFGEVVWLYAMFMSVVAGLLLDRDFGYMVVTFTASIVAARGVYGCKKREDLYWAGIKTGLINALLIFCVTLISQPFSAMLRRDLLWNTSAGFLSGIIACFVTLTLIPLWERLFTYTTDVRLLELSNLNHPLLKELIVKAPGTYHHSLVVGSMCEAAAESIGANPLLAKVAAYYHDIGKTNHPQYFIENQRMGENPHDHLNPAMSKTVLVAHVKDGVEMGLKYKLGQPIIDVIEQHHGTTLISFFYHRAKENENAEMHEVTENEYRYPGSKPQFREAALCMLADSIEAAARTLDEPTPARLQTIVHNIVQRKFLDGQLAECDLTLRDLSQIEEAFGKVLMGIYHHRIDYPSTPKSSSATARKA